jgi:hypothetical protein
MFINSDEYIPYRKRGYEFIHREIEAYHDGFLKPAVAKLKLDKVNDRHLQTLLESKRPSGFLPMSNRYIRERAWHYLANELADFFIELVAHGNMPRFWFLTCCWDDGFTFVDNPQIDFGSMRQKVRNALSENGLNGTTALETHPFRDKWVGESARRLCAHSHSIVWSYDPDFDPVDVEGRMQKRFPNMLGAKGFKFSTRAQYVQKELQAGRYIADPGADMTVEDLIYLAAYMVKAPNAMKRIVRNKEDPTKISLKTTSDSFSGKLALQMAQIWSQMSPFDTFFGTGEGAKVRGKWAQEMRNYEKRNRGRTGLGTPEFDISSLWSDIGLLNPAMKLGKSSIIR